MLLSDSINVDFFPDFSTSTPQKKENSRLLFCIKHVKENTLLIKQFLNILKVSISFDDFTLKLA